MTETNSGLVQIRTPTYKRPVVLQRALQSMVDQTWANWVCDVYDDDADQAGRAVCEGFNDPRIRYHHNAPQRFASKNIDQCFTAENPNDADYFCVVEDDNFILPEFLADNLRICRDDGVNVVLRNQLVEYASGTPSAKLSEGGVLDDLFVEGLYEPDEFRLSLLMGIGVSNGGLFWSRNTQCQLEIGFGCTATLQEYMRSFSIVEPIYVAMQPLAVWAENAEQTTRNAELKASYLRRELDLKRSVQALQRLAWQGAPKALRANFMTNPKWAAEAPRRSSGLAKALIMDGAYSAIALQDSLRLQARGVAIRVLGRVTPDFHAFVQSRQVAARR